MAWPFSSSPQSGDHLPTGVGTRAVRRSTLCLHLPIGSFTARFYQSSSKWATSTPLNDILEANACRQPIMAVLQAFFCRVVQFHELREILFQSFYIVGFQIAIQVE